MTTAAAIRYCRTCLMPNSRPRIVFDAEGICNACHTAKSRANIDWGARLGEFRRLVEANRPASGPYDCLVPWSGGKDSSRIAYALKFEHGLNPLLVTFSPLIPNDIGEHNREALLRAGFDHVMVRPNQKVARHLARRFFVERGNPKVHWDAGVNSAPVQMAVRYKIPLIFYAEHGESEYGGRVLSEEHRKIRDITEVLEHQIGDHPENWIDEVVEARDLAPYAYPEPQEIAAVGAKALYFAYFFPWDVTENYEYIRSKIDFQIAKSGRSDGTYTSYDSLDDKIDNLYYYLQFVKFGFGRAARDASRQIYRGRMTRDEALEMVRKYDDEFPHTFHKETLEYLGLDQDEFTSIIDLHRNREIWEQTANGWKLRFPPV